jgi:hypothetical protein
VICPGTLALPGDRRRDETERVELSVRVLQRGTGVRALVDDQVDERRVGMGAKARAPGRDGTGELIELELFEAGHVARDVDDHLVGPGGGLGGEQVDSRAAPRSGQGVDRARETGFALPGAGREYGIEVRDRALRPAGGIGCTARRSVGPDLGRGAVLAPLAERTALDGIGAQGDGRRRERIRALRPTRGENRSQAGELVDPDLGRGQD